MAPPEEPMPGDAKARIQGEAPDSSSMATYFCTYSFLYHQKEMLEDHKRSGAYYQAVRSNKRQFAGKVVLDVGTGSGILAIFAAKAGASKVYAVEATNMAASARKLAEHNGVGDIVEVIQGTIESVELPEKVDIIISEWMGYFLLRESMLDSVLVARDKFLKPGGALYPSHATMYLAPIQTPGAQHKLTQFHSSMEGWAEFLQQMKKYYQVDLECLNDDYRKEQKEFFMNTSQWTDTHPGQLLGPPAVIKNYDLHTVTLEEIKAPLKANFTMYAPDGGPIDAFCGWFDVQFKGSKENPADVDVRLSTSPDPTGATHWGQQTFHMHPPIDCGPHDSLECSIEVARREDNHRLLCVKLGVKVEGTSIFHSTSPRQLQWNID